MARKFAGGRLVIASHNPGKVMEIAALLAPYRIDAVGAAELSLAEPEETGATFEANASLKARAAAQSARLPALADDSGLVVPALGGAPGVYSARWAGPGRDFTVAMERVHRELGGNDRHASFVSILALAWPNGEEALFRGEVHGHLTWPPRGDNGFGYDPIFIPEDSDITYGEMTLTEKFATDHRARAFAKLAAAVFPLRPLGGEGGTREAGG
jgi:XTP/dITP diphosphohydrolase